MDQLSDSKRRKALCAKNISGFTLLVILPVVLACGCGEMGKVEQGRVIAFDKAKETVTLIRDIKLIRKTRITAICRPLIYEIPKDPSEMGRRPKAGRRMKLDAKAKEIVIFDPASQNFKKIDYTLIDQKEGVAKDNPLVAGKKFPGGQGQEGHHHLFRPAKDPDHLLGAGRIPDPAG